MDKDEKMLKPRIIPCLLLKNRGFVKTTKFKDPRYIGDPINIIRIFNNKEVDEIVVLDITASSDNHKPRYELLEQIASECFVPLSYGGGIRSFDDAKRILAIGFEKIVLNSCLPVMPELVRELADAVGSQSIVVSIDVRQNILGKYDIYTHSGTKKIKKKLSEYVLECEKLGAGEILINSITRDGTMHGYDLSLIKYVTSMVKIPVVACGGAGSINDLKSAVREGGASAAAAGSLFIYHGPHHAVLINVPDYIEQKKIFQLP